jgi:hypothetical protein
LLKSDHLIIFTRYPTPGKTKTRLIPALGAAGAAELQRQLTEYTVAQARSLTPQLSLEVRFAGGDTKQMAAWLGRDLTYHLQAEGDLGTRMAQAFQQAFSRGAERVVTIGIDCPQIGSERLRTAFAKLQAHDLVLGPATDGGYYLIGLRRFVPDLFMGVDWGTGVVYRQTTAIAERRELAIAPLDPLTDIDRPGDLWVWEQVQRTLEPLASPEKISVIIPVLNEAAILPRTLAQFKDYPDLELIVVDGGSDDDTGAVAQGFEARLLTTAPGRAGQMNQGAKSATGDILLFLHADTLLPPRFPDLIRHTLAPEDVVAGAFDLQIDGQTPGLRWVERGVKWRSRWFQMPYGDQGLFLRPSVFWAVGGFPDLPIMEDFALVQRLQRQGRIALPDPASHPSTCVLTSGRRWQKLGVFRTTLINQLVIAGYFLGIPPARLASWYRKS